VSYPASLAGDVVARFGPAPPSRCGYFQPAMSDSDVRAFVESLRASVVQKRTAALRYLASEPWDLFVVGFKEGHCAGHGLWNFADPDHPEFDEARAARLDRPVRQVFADLDSAIGDLVAAAGPDADVVVFSTTSMAPNGSIDHLMPQVVMRLNAALSGRPATAWEKAASGLTASLPARAAKRLSPILEASRRDRRSAAFVELMPWSDDAAALALRARAESESGEQARRLRETVALLRELRDVESGRPVVSDITFPSAETRGPRVDCLPDCLVHYSKGLTPRAIMSPGLGRVGARRRRRRPGNHESGALVVVAGARALAHAERLNAMEDFAPFAEAVLGP
jgi:hypothetical protein